jgi:hypothetical protein
MISEALKEGKPLPPSLPPAFQAAMLLAASNQPVDGSQRDEERGARSDVKLRKLDEE